MSTRQFILSGRKVFLAAIWFLLSAYGAGCRPSPAPPPPTSTPLPLVVSPDYPSRNPLYANPDQAAEPPERIHFEQLSIEDGLSSSAVNDILQDRYGYLWFATSQGLNRYDGYNFQVFTHDPQDPDSLSENNVLTLYEDRQGSLWIGTYGGGLNLFNRSDQQFIHFRHDPQVFHSLSSDIVDVVYEDSRQNLWVGTLGGGLNRFDRRTGRFIRYLADPEDPASLPDNNVMALLEDRYGAIWVGTNGGLARLEDRTSGTFTVYHHDPDDPTSISSERVFSLLEDDSGTLWLGTMGGGLNRLNSARDRFTYYRHDPLNSESLISNNVYGVIEDQRGNLWLGTTGNGVDFFNRQTGRFQHYRHDPSDPDSLSSDYISALIQDSEGTLWFGTAEGLNRYTPGRIEFAQLEITPSQYADPINLSGMLVFALEEDWSGALWVGTDQGLYWLSPDGSAAQVFLHDPENPDSIADNWITDIHRDRFGILWVGTKMGLDQLPPGSTTVIHHQNDRDLPAEWSWDRVNKIYEDRSGQIWIATEAGLASYDRMDETFTIYKIIAEPSRSLTDNTIVDLIESRAGVLYVATWGSGIWEFDRRQNIFIPAFTGMEASEILYIHTFYEDYLGEIWVGTWNRGLAHFDPESSSLTFFHAGDGVAPDNVSAILQDSRGYFWLGTERQGLFRFDPSLTKFRNYDVGDGLPGNSFYSAACRRRNGEMIFGGPDGAVIFDPENFRENEYIPPIALIGLSQNGTTLDLADPLVEEGRLQFKWPQNDFEFEFTSLSFVQPDKNRYAYQLVGYDEGWNYVGTDHNGRYVNIPGGKYVLKIKGTNNDNVWNEEGVALELSILPPLWQTLWFQGGLALAFLVAFGAAYRFRMQRIQEHNRVLETIVQQRTAEIERRRQELEALYRADEVMYRSLNLDLVLQALVDVAVDLLHADKSFVLVWDASSQRLVPRVARGFSSQNLGHLISGWEDGVIGRVAATGDPVFMSNAQQESRRLDERAEMIELLFSERIQSFMHLPLRVENEVFGVFNVSFNQVHAFGDQEQRLFLALAQRASLAIENARYTERVQELAVMTERNRLARDLHDSAKQKAFAALAQLGAVAGLIERQPHAAGTHLEEAESLVHEVLQEIALLIDEMYPAALKERGLQTILRDYVFDWESQNQVEIDLQISGEYHLPLEVEQVLYRITQEALSNVARHSCARKVQMSLSCEADCAVLRVCDDGCGFDLKAPSDGIGLRSMRERCEVIGANFRVESQVDHGTCVIVEVSF